MFCVDESKCTGCGSCLDACPRGAIQPAIGGVSIDQRRCNGCGACVDICPAGDIRKLVPQHRAVAVPPESLTELPLPVMSQRTILPPLLGRRASGRRRRHGQRWRM
jgi:ferredoxin